MQKKSVLIFIDWFTPGYKAGGPTRSIANMAEHLSECFALFIVTRSNDYMEHDPYPFVVSDKWNVFSPNVHVFYASDKLINLNLYKQLIEYKHFDAIYINGIFSWKFSILPVIAAKKSKCNRIIIGSRGMLAQSALNIKRSKKIPFLKIASLLGLYTDVRFHATNEKEKEEIIGCIGKKTSVHIAENFAKKTITASQTIEKKIGRLKLLSVARVSKEKNTLHAIQLLSRINQQISFDIYGQIYDQNYWEECCKEIKRLPANISVSYKGTISPDRMDQLLSNYHCLFIPTKGENFGHAIFESLLAGRPVLISDQTPWQDLEEHKAGKVFPLENNDSFENGLIEMAKMNQLEYNIWAKGARNYADDYLTKVDLKEKYLEMFS